MPRNVTPSATVEAQRAQHRVRAVPSRHRAGGRRV